MKAWWKSRTMWAQAVIAALGMAVEMSPTVRELLPTHLGGWIIVGLAVVNAVLRTITSQPLGRGEGQ